MKLIQNFILFLPKVIFCKVLDKEQSIQVLNKYFLEHISPLIFDIITENDFYFKVTKKRCSKYGDFKPLHNGKSKITVNNDLDKDHFLTTFLHEFAHFKVWQKVKNLQNPHGELWKLEFYNLLNEFHNQGGFSVGLSEQLLKTFRKRNNTISFSKNKMSEILSRNISEDVRFLKELSPKEQFIDSKGNAFEILEKRRTRFLCRNIKTKRLFLIHGLFKIKTI